MSYCFKVLGTEYHVWKSIVTLIQSVESESNKESVGWVAVPCRLSAMLDRTLSCWAESQSRHAGHMMLT